MIRPIDLKTNNSTNPLGIDSPEPEFSWQLAAEGRARSQSAYRIRVCRSPQALEAGAADAWDSGIVRCGTMHGIAYAGAPLPGRTRFWWTVQVWDEQDRCCAPEAPAFFETALMAPQEWGEARWIGGESLLRKEFRVDRACVAARAYVTGLAYYEFYLNGRKVGDQVLSPSFTDYRKRIEYQVYDVTALLRPGVNAAGMFLGGQWPRDYPVANVTDAAYYHGELTALLRLELAYADGTRECVTSGPDWRCGSGPVVSSSVYDGETYDARLEQRGWCEPGFDETSWQPVRVCPPQGAALFAQHMPPIMVVARRAPVSVEELRPGVWAVDVGREVAGWLALRARGPRGAALVARYAELRHEDGTVNQDTLRGARCTDTWLLRGEGSESYEPRFTYHGFRYVQVECAGGAELDRANLEVCIVRSSVRETGSFSCSNELINRIHQAMKLTIESSLYGIPAEDAARDERQGWMADGVACVEAAICGFDMQQFYRKWLADIRDVQDPLSGNLEQLTAPPFQKGESFEWTFAYFQLVHLLLACYDDRASVRAYYPHLKHYCDYLATREKGGLLQMGGMGDWLGIQPTKPEFVITPLYCRALRIMAGLASAIGLPQEAGAWAAKADAVAAGYHEAFYNQHRTVCHLDKPSGYYGSVAFVTQLANALPLLFGITPEADRAAVEAMLVWQLTRARGTTQLTTGVIGTKYLFDTLARIGRNDLAWELFNRTAHPSWGFMLSMGATTIWERWEYMIGNEMNLHSLITLGAPDAWLYRELAGIRFAGFDDEGRRVFCVNPFFPGTLDRLACRMETPWGAIGVAWERAGRRTELRLDVPVNCRCSLRLDPGARPVSSLDEGETALVRRGRARAAAAEGITGVAVESGRVTVETGSGSYRFVVQGRAGRTGSRRAVD